MNRNERVFQQLVAVWKNSTKTDIFEIQGSSANDIAKSLGLSRANVSSELNKLVRMNRVVKIKHYPVKYLPKEIVANYFEEDVVNRVQEVNDLKTNLLNHKKYDEVAKKSDPFEAIIGYENSLKKPISQAKAAIHYPPMGLHMLIVGQTGSGKTFFADKVYQYAVYSNILEENAPFIKFNCADYYTNPQLLMSQLFGYIKGAFTGADVDQVGLIEKAHNGILLLDEVHRLPPEGQEMLFYFIDDGKFNRLGESGFNRSANVTIICATTETPNSVLLETFQRRIPMLINIPSFNEKPLKEKVALVNYLFEIEAIRVKRTLAIDIDVMNALVHSVPYGNVGQLKTRIQLTCAQAFLNQLHEKGNVRISLDNLPDDVREFWKSASHQIKTNTEINSYVEITTIIFADKTTRFSEEEPNTVNIYELIQDKVQILEGEGFSLDEIQQYILTDLHTYIRNFISSSSVNYSLLKFVDPEISALTIQLKAIAEKELATQFDNRFLYYIAMHLYSFVHRDSINDSNHSIEIQKIITEKPEEYEVAKLFGKNINEQLNIKLPEIEIIYLAMLIGSIKTLDEVGKVSILVVAHGNTTASSMVDVANELLGNSPIWALNMPLDEPPERLFDKIVDTILSIESREGVLMLVDMGSLCMIEDKLIEKTKVKIKTIANVTTSIVLDVVRKVNYMNLDLSSIYHSVNRDFFSSLTLQDDFQEKGKVIVSICSSGKGTAKKLERMITKIINSQTEEPVEVVTLSTTGMEKKVPSLLKKYEVLATVGTQRIAPYIPHISLEMLVDGSGEELLRQCLGKFDGKSLPVKQENILLKDLCYDTLNMYLMYLNPTYITELLLEWVNLIQIKLEKNFTNAFSLKLIVHTAFAFERIIKADPLEYSDEWTDRLKEGIELVSESLMTLEKSIHLNLAESEKAFIVEILYEVL